MRTAVTVLCLLGMLFVKQDAEAGTAFDLMRETAVSWTGELPCGNWDCECAFKRQRGCCCVAGSVFQLEEDMFGRMVGLWQGLSTLNSKLGELTGPDSKVAFTAVMSPMSMGSQCFGPFTSHVPISYTNVQLNQGFGYNPALGIFTAPRTGVYSFSYSVYSNVGSSGERLYHMVQLMRDGVEVASTWEDNREDSEDSGSQTVVLQLRRGCQVYMQLFSGRMLCGDTEGHNRFSGYLLYPLSG
ncbi:cerebellin 18 [Alosa sapidissima]|uniref:cerebellin 18 n=1 Tax=Alosa sapidissima TaxID=34773 RepID=UPI001C0954DE|nr:cerebellin 18 [Alosa sapidissima]XP_041919906.1 cerebellin 18 [Alosa sapidissima]XP_041919907.1 cerebellin 18 [Alosa sapidissima]